jgi:hypothetical protein
MSIRSVPNAGNYQGTATMSAEPFPSTIKKSRLLAAGQPNISPLLLNRNSAGFCLAEIGFQKICAGQTVSHQ